MISTGRRHEKTICEYGTVVIEYVRTTRKIVQMAID